MGLGISQGAKAKWRLGAKIGIFFFKYPDIFFGLNLSASSKTASEFLSEPPGGRNRNFFFQISRYPLWIKPFRELKNGVGIFVRAPWRPKSESGYP